MTRKQEAKQKFEAIEQFHQACQSMDQAYAMMMEAGLEEFAAPLKATVEIIRPVLDRSVSYQDELLDIITLNDA